MPQPIRTCVLGVGLAGLTFHIPFILASESFTLVSVLERNPTSEGGKLHQRFGVTAKIHNTFEQVLADPQVQLVVIGAADGIRCRCSPLIQYRNSKSDPFPLRQSGSRGRQTWYEGSSSIRSYPICHQSSSTSPSHPLLPKPGNSARSHALKDSFFTLSTIADLIPTFCPSKTCFHSLQLIHSRWEMSLNLKLS
jgi:hypothetical protein